MLHFRVVCLQRFGAGGDGGKLRLRAVDIDARRNAPLVSRQDELMRALISRDCLLQQHLLRLDTAQPDIQICDRRLEAEAG